MDATEKLVFESEISAAVLGKGDEFVLVNLAHYDQAVPDAARARGYHFCGVVGLMNGRLSLEIASPDPESVRLMAFALREFTDMCAANSKPDAFADWMTKLHELPDTRENLGGTK